MKPDAFTLFGAAILLFGIPVLTLNITAGFLENGVSNVTLLVTTSPVVD